MLKTNNTIVINNYKIIVKGKYVYKIKLKNN